MDMEEEQTAGAVSSLPLQYRQQQQQQPSPLQQRLHQQQPPPQQHHHHHHHHHHQPPLLQQQQQQHPQSQTSSLKNKPRLTFLLVAFFVGELGDGLNIFQGIYLVTVANWNEGSVGAALSLMGLVSLATTPLAGDWVDKMTRLDRRVLLALASMITGLSASAILLVHHHHSGNQNNNNNAADHLLIYATKTMEGLASSFIMPCLAALTLANFGPRHFDSVYAGMLTAAHLGSVVAAVLAGTVAYYFYPNIRYCFLVIGASAAWAIFFIHYLPQGDVLMGRGFLPASKVCLDEHGQLERLDSDETTVAHDNHVKDLPPTPASYWQVFFDFKTCLLCLTGFFFQYVCFKHRYHRLHTIHSDVPMSQWVV
jgi:MFS family permease